MSCPVCGNVVTMSFDASSNHFIKKCNTEGCAAGRGGNSREALSEFDLSCKALMPEEAKVQKFWVCFGSLMDGTLYPHHIADKEEIAKSAQKDRYIPVMVELEFPGGDPSKMTASVVKKPEVTP